MTFEYRPAVRQKIGGLIAIAGPSGSGKTRTALHVAKGLANGVGSIAVIDTEAGRALHYAPKPGDEANSAKGTFKFHHVDFQPPFTPERYVEAIRFCEEQGATVIVLDSKSHEWAGEGGCADIQAAEAERMARAAASKSSPSRPWESMLDAMTAPAWAKPKIRHKRMVSRLLQSRAHLIFCLRAEEKVRISGGKVTPIGFQPICEKSFMFEMTCSMMLNPAAPGAPDYNLPHKLSDELQAIFPHGELIGDDAGKHLRAWLESGIERPVLDKIAEGARDLAEQFEDAADIDALNRIASDPKVLKQRGWLLEKRPDLSAMVEAAFSKAAERLAPVFDDAPDEAAAA